MIFEDYHDNKMDEDLDIDIFTFFGNETRRRIFIGKAWLRQALNFKPVCLTDKKYKFLLIIFQYICLSLSVSSSELPSNMGNVKQRKEE